MDRFDTLQLFVRVVESGSFSKAARALGIVQPTVSKQVAALEARLGAQLLHRTSRGLSLTDSGQDFYDSAIKLLGDFEDAEARIGHRQAAPSGMVRVATSPALGRMFIIPRLPDFYSRFPDVTLDLVVSERRVNMVEDGVDLALRIGHLSDSSLLARRIGTMTACTVASAAYLERRGTPATPEDLDGHDCIGYVYDGGATTWGLETPEGPIAYEPAAKLRSNDAEYIRAAVIAGLGVSHNASWLYAPELAAGTVRQILGDYAPAGYPIHAVTPGGRRIPSRVRAFADFLADICASEPHLRLR